LKKNPLYYVAENKRNLYDIGINTYKNLSVVVLIQFFLSLLWLPNLSLY